MMALLAACGAPQTGSAVGGQTVDIGGAIYQVEQLTASTWTARRASAGPDGAEQDAGLVKAVEKASGCKVTGNTPGQQADVLYAQVACGNRLEKQ